MKLNFKSLFFLIGLTGFALIDGMETGQTEPSSEVGQRAPLQLKYQTLFKKLAEPKGYAQIEELLKRDADLKEKYDILNPQILGLTPEEAKNVYSKLLRLDSEQFDALFNLIKKVQKVFGEIPALGEEQISEIFTMDKLDENQLNEIKKASLKNIISAALGLDWTTKASSRRESSKELMGMGPAGRKIKLEDYIVGKSLDHSVSDLIKLDKELSVAYDKFFQAFKERFSNYLELKNELAKRGSRVPL